MYHLKSHHKETSDRSAIAEHYRCDEGELLQQLLPLAQLSPPKLQQAKKCALQLAGAVREVSRAGSGIQNLLNQYSLSTHEGIVLMCLAEALLRIPDSTTADHLIRDKLMEGDWSTHLGMSDSLFVNASAWGLLVSGRVVSFSDEHHRERLGRLQLRMGKMGTPVVRAAMRQAMKIMGRQFVLGRTINEAIGRGGNAQNQGYRYSYDMLGEASRTMADADACYRSYAQAIETIGRSNAGRGVYDGDGISVKLSAIHPRYEFAQRGRLMTELVGRLKSLALLAREYDIGLTVDAEEADRLDLSLDIIEAVYTDADLAGWAGFGIVVQAYMKRALPVLQWAIDLSRSVGRQLNVRLVKGAYWDTEIKQAQVNGLAGYPVFTRKENTDVSYQACAALLLDNRDAVYPQFATHNAYSVAHVLAYAENKLSGFEFQRLHGMGDGLYDDLVSQGQLPVRIYAPVGEHKNLLAYLVRRLLENGANSSFVNNIIDDQLPLESLVQDPCERASANCAAANPRIPLPASIYGNTRHNARGLDLSDTPSIQRLSKSAQALQNKLRTTGAEAIFLQSSTSPASTKQLLGYVRKTTPQDMLIRLESAEQAFKQWSQLPVEQRAQHFEKLADLLETNMEELIALCTLEAGKTAADGVAEVREAVDFCRYYAGEAHRACGPHPQWEAAGQMHARGVVLCISPWNFPLAIFLGQVCAALVTGNAVLAKPADTTPLIAQRAVELIIEAGIPAQLVQLIVAEGPEVGQHLLPDARLAGVMFTGSTQVGAEIARCLAMRPGPRIPLVAETGGQNCMVVDSSALPEQVVDDIIASGFQSAGQRCSALRVLFVQEEVADDLIAMIIGAMQELRVGDPAQLSTDVGPVIDQRSLDKLQGHVVYMRQHGRLLYACELTSKPSEGTFFAPHLYEIDRLEVLRGEVFGPVVHLIRYASKNLPEIIKSINATGFGLTAGIHSRVGTTTRKFSEKINAGNIYINRNMIGAIVGVQPFGGHGLSGTGPKAGGPHYLYRLLQASVTTNIANELQQKISCLLTQAEKEFAGMRELTGPTGELNQWLCEPRGGVLCIDEDPESNRGTLHAIAALVAANRVIHVSAHPLDRALLAQQSELWDNYQHLSTGELGDKKTYLARFHIDAVTFAGTNAEAQSLQTILLGLKGPMVPLIDDYFSPALLHRFVLEKSISTDTTAAGGNASLLIDS